MTVTPFLFGCVLVLTAHQGYHDWWLAISYQLSAISYQLSAISYQHWPHAVEKGSG